MLLQEFINRACLFTVSLSGMACGPLYTYSNADIHTTVDYCIVDSAAAHLIDRCRVLDNHPLDLSDHIPISVSLNKELISCHRPTPQIRLDWRKANTDGLIINLSFPITSLQSYHYLYTVLMILKMRYLLSPI